MESFVALTTFYPCLLGFMFRELNQLNTVMDGQCVKNYFPREKKNKEVNPESFLQPVELFCFQFCLRVICFLT